MSYSQNDEEEAILAHFGGAGMGRFLDIGAHDGVSFSNTRRLAEMGWSGTLVEPSPSAFAKLMDLYRNREDMRLVHVAMIVGDAGMLKFHDSRGDLVSTFDDAHRAVWSAPDNNRPGVNYQPIYVGCTNMPAFLNRFPGPYDFLNLDVEGINFELFKTIRLRELGVSLACVEYQDKLLEIEELAGIQGYRRYHRTSENVLLVRNVN